MKEVAITSSHSPVDLRLGQREEKHSVTLRPIEQTSKISDSKAEEFKDSSERNNDGLIIANVKKNLEKLNQFIPVTSTNLSFEFDESGESSFIRVMDKEKEEVIREIPSEEFREVAKALDELADKLSGKGLLFNHSA